MKAISSRFFRNQRKDRSRSLQAEPNRAPAAYRTVVAANALFLALIFIAAGFWLINLNNTRTETELAHEAKRLKTSYEATQNELEHQLTVLAGEIAADAGVIRILTLAAQAGPEDFAGLHNELHHYLTPRWENFKQTADIKQMQVVIPGTISLLRLHQPDEYGDSLKGVRHLLNKVEETLLPQSGFETGRAFSGLRGAAPILQKTASGTKRHLGTVEIGIQFDGYLSRIGRQTGVGYGVLLKPGPATEIMWEEQQPVVDGPEGNSRVLLLTASRGELAGWLTGGKLPRYDDKFSNGLLAEHGRIFQVIRFPLEEFRSKFAQAPPIGSIVIWQEVGKLIEAKRRYQWEAAFYLGLAYLLAVGLTIFILRLSCREWERQLAARADELARLSRQKEILLEAMGEGVYGVSLDSCCTFVNNEALRMTGFAREEIIGHDQHALFHHHHPDGSPYPRSECPIHKTMQDGLFRSREEWFIRKNGDGFPVRLTAAAVEDNGSINGAVVVFRDIAEQKHEEEELLRLATTDPLTGLANRRHFLEQLAQEIRRVERSGGSAALIMLDLDLFKLVNDSYGHAAGDLVLQRFAALIRQTLRQIDISGRLGGEEFAVILPDSDLTAAMEAGERLRKLMEAEIIISDANEIRITTSIGVTPLHPDDKTPDKPLSRADKALYAAKYLGRNRVESR